MNFWNNLSITFRIVLLSTILAAIFLGGSFYFVTLGARDQLIEKVVNELQLNIQIRQDIIEDVVLHIPERMQSIKRTPPFLGIVRANNNDGYDTLGKSSIEDWRQRLEQIFAAEMEAEGTYDQLRYLDTDGNELVRVDYIDGVSKVIPKSRLQNKYNRDYFQEATQLKPTEIYISKLELNREGTPPTISVPYRPVIRYAVQIIDERQNVVGFLIANINGKKILPESELMDGDSNILSYVVDGQGFFLFHPDKNKRWGGPHDLNTGITISQELPSVDISNLNKSSGVITDTKNFYAYSSIKLQSDRKWFLIEKIPRQIVLGSINSLIRNTALIGMSIFVVLFFIFLFVVRYMLAPLSLLSKAAEEIGEGNFKAVVPIRGTDEIGRVGTMFNEMTQRLSGLYESMDETIQEKTVKLDKKVLQLEKTQKAITNILEDVEIEKDKIETILSSIDDAVFVVDKNLEIQLFNKACEKMTGVISADAIGKNYKKVLNFVNEYTKRGTSKFITHTLRTGNKQKRDGHLLLVTKEGVEIPVAESVAPIKDQYDNVIGVVVVFRDITSERSIDKAKTEFVSLASHQLRTPLTTVNWYAEMLLTGDAGKLTKDQKAFIKEIYQGNKRMADLVNALLNVSRIELGTFAVDVEPVNLKKLAKDALKDLHSLAEKHETNIIEKYDSKLGKYQGDPKLLLIIFQNLLSNAIKYTPDGGDVTLEIKAKQKDDILSIKVSDTGYGIPEAEKANIFQKLYRADNIKQKNTTGTGLGLYIIKSIIEESKGRIWFESEEDKGTTFFIELPLSGMTPKEGSKPLES